MHNQWSLFFIKVVKSPRSYDFLKQIELNDIVDNMKKFQIQHWNFEIFLWVHAPRPL